MKRRAIVCAAVVLCGFLTIAVSRADEQEKISQNQQAEPAPWPKEQFPDFSNWQASPSGTGNYDIDQDGKADFFQETLYAPGTDFKGPLEKVESAIVRRRPGEDPIFVAWNNPKEHKLKVALKTVTTGDWEIIDGSPETLFIFALRSASDGLYYIHVLYEETGKPRQAWRHIY